MKATPSPTTSGSPGAAELAHQAALTDRLGLFRLMQCHLLHRGDWQYLGTRHQDGNLHWPIDAFHCDRCERDWERAG
jgi:hypothetical protein